MAQIKIRPDHSNEEVAKYLNLMLDEIYAGTIPGLKGDQGDPGPTGATGATGPAGPTGAGA